MNLVTTRLRPGRVRRDGASGRLLSPCPGRTAVDRHVARLKPCGADASMVTPDELEAS